MGKLKTYSSWDIYAVGSACSPWILPPTETNHVIEYQSSMVCLHRDNSMRLRHLVPSFCPHMAYYFTNVLTPGVKGPCILATDFLVTWDTSVWQIFQPCRSSTKAEKVSRSLVSVIMLLGRERQENWFFIIISTAAKTKRLHCIQADQLWSLMSHLPKTQRVFSVVGKTSSLCESIWCYFVSWQRDGWHPNFPHEEL